MVVKSTLIIYLKQCVIPGDDDSDEVVLTIDCLQSIWGLAIKFDELKEEVTFTPELWLTCLGTDRQEIIEAFVLCKDCSSWMRAKVGWRSREAACDNILNGWENKFFLLPVNRVNVKEKDNQNQLCVCGWEEIKSFLSSLTARKVQLYV